MLTPWLAAGLALALAPAAALAHGESRVNVRVLLDEVQPPVPGLRVQVYDDHLAPQLVVENLTGSTLQVLDLHGRPFLRLDARGVEADLAAAAWYATLSPAGTAMPPRARRPRMSADWRRVRAAPSWGWFDRRLDKRLAPPPPAHGTQPRVLRRWRVPLRLGRRALEIRGHFLYQPQPTGTFVARLAAGELAPGVRVTLAPGQPPALLLENRGREPVWVLGAQGEPFLRIAAEGTDANLASPTWQDLGRYRGLEPPLGVGEGAVRWQRVSPAPRYGWLEPRAGRPAPSAPPDPDHRAALGWEIPVRIGARDTAIRGVTEWRPASPPPRASH